MSGFIHIGEQARPWQAVLRALCMIAAMAALAWALMPDDGLPMAPPAEHAAVPRPEPVAVPRIDMHLEPDPAVASLDEPHAASARPVAAESDPSTDAIAADDYAARNAAIDPRRLTATRPLAARSFLNEVLIAPGTQQAGFVVAQVLPQSRYERMGLQPGDVVYTLDTPKMSVVDEGSMVALMQQGDLELDVYRNGSLLRLHMNLADDVEEPHADRR